MNIKTEGNRSVSHSLNVLSWGKESYMSRKILESRKLKWKEALWFEACDDIV